MTLICRLRNAPVRIAPQRTSPERAGEVLAGIVDRVTFHNEENGFCVMRVKARGHRDLVTVIGHAATISVGEWITVIGDWVNDRDSPRLRHSENAEPQSVIDGR